MASFRISAEPMGILLVLLLALGGRLSAADGNQFAAYSSSMGAGSSLVACMRPTHGRVGTSPSICSPGQEKSGWACYPPCTANYTGSGSTCKQDCPEDLFDLGDFCAKPSNESCPGNMTEFGSSCVKPRYNRGPGSLPGCTSNEQLSGLVCYSSCESGFVAVGPTCWSQCTNPQFPTECGPFCSANMAGCSKLLQDLGSLAAVSLQTAVVTISYLAACAVTTFASPGAAAACYLNAFKSVSDSGGIAAGIVSEFSKYC